MNYGAGIGHLNPTTSPYLFRNLLRNLDSRANVLLYIDPERFEAERDSSMHLARGLAKDPYFNVGITTSPDAELARYADIVIPRFDPPIKPGFLEELEFYDDATRLFINPPQTQRYFSNKKYLEDIAREHPELFPRTKISSDPKELGAFLYELSKNSKYAVYKPLEGFGGDGIGRINLQGEDLKREEDYIHLAYGLSQGKEIILQEFIDNIAQYGDKRIHILNQHPIGAVLRIPKKGSWLCNQKKGASLELSELTDKDYELIEKVNPYLQKQNAYWTGIDVIGPYLGEINAVSPGLLYALDEFNDWKIMPSFVEKIKQEAQGYADVPREVLVA